MTVEDKEALFGEAVAQLHHYSGGDPGYKNVLAGDVRTTAEALGDARALEEHVKTCRVRSPIRSPYERDGHRACGDKWYCEDAPKGGT